MQWGKGRVRDWIPRPVLDKMRPGQGEGLDTKAGIGRSGARTRSGTGFQGWYWTKWGQGRVLDCVTRPLSDEMGPGQGQGLGSKPGMGRNGAKAGSGTGGQGRYWMKWGEDRVRDWTK